MIEELKRVKANETKIGKYEEGNEQFIQNRLFETNQKFLLTDLNAWRGKIV